MKQFIVTFKNRNSEVYSAEKEEDIRTAFRKGRYGDLPHWSKTAIPILESKIVSIEEVKPENSQNSLD